MKIGIDGFNLALRRGTGVATYARTLARAVNELGFSVDLLYGLPVSPKTRLEVRESLFFAQLGEGSDFSAPPKATLRRAIRRALISPADRHMVPIPVTGRVLTTDFDQRLPTFDRLFTLGGLFSISERYFRRYRRFMTVRVPDPPTIMHWTYPLPIRLAGAANLYTIHDLVPLRLPHTSLEDKAYYDSLIRECLRTAAHIVTVSEASRRDILELFPVDPARVTNTYQPVDVPTDLSDDDTLTQRLDRLFDLKRDGYFLFFGAIEPKKNVGRMIEAYLSSGVETPLIIVGAGGWRSEQELRLINGAHGKRLNGADRIRVIDYLPRPLLMELVRGARAVLFPSLYEGFGLPAVEAMALGTPVITSNTGALPEIVGDATIMVDPYDVRAIASKLVNIHIDPSLRTSFSSIGHTQVKKFAKENYQQSLINIYKNNYHKSQR